MSLDHTLLTLNVAMTEYTRLEKEFNALNITADDSNDDLYKRLDEQLSEQFDALDLALYTLDMGSIDDNRK